MSTFDNATMQDVLTAPNGTDAAERMTPSDKVIEALRQIGLWDRFDKGTTAPADLSRFWLDQNTTPAIPKYHNGTAWVAAGFDNVWRPSVLSFDTAANARLIGLTGVSQISIGGIHYNAITAGPADSGGLNPQYLVVADGATFEREYLEGIDAREFDIVFDFDTATFTGTDNTAAWAAMWNEVAGMSAPVELIMPPGKALIPTGWTASLAGDVTIRARGSGLSSTLFYQDANTANNALIDATCTTTSANVLIALSDFGVRTFDSALGPGVLPTTSAQVQTSGTAISLARNPVPLLRPSPEVYLTRLGVESHDNLQGQYDKDIRLVGMRFPRLYDNWCMSGFQAAVFPDKHEDTWAPYQKTASLELDSCWGPEVEHGQYRGGGDRAVLIDSGTGSEGGTFRRVASAHTKCGFQSIGNDNQPGLQFFECHPNARDCMYDIQRGKGVTIENSYNYLEDDRAASAVTPVYYKIGADAGEDITIKGAREFFQAHPNSANTILIQDLRTGTETINAVATPMEFSVGNIHANNTNEFAKFYESAVNRPVNLLGSVSAPGAATMWDNGGTTGVQYQFNEGNNTKYFGYGTPAHTGIEDDIYIDIDGSSGYTQWRNYLGTTWKPQQNNSNTGQNVTVSATGEILIPFDHGGFIRLTGDPSENISAFTYPAGYTPRRGERIVFLNTSPQRITFPDVGNVRGGGASIDAGGVAAFNYDVPFGAWYLEQGFGSSGGGIALTDLPRPWNVRIITSADSPVTAAHGDILSCDSSGGIISITLPAATAANAQFVEVTTGGSANTNSIIINTTGADTVLGQSSITHNLNGHTYVYRAHSAGAYN